MSCMNILSKLTIVIITYNRQNFIERQLEYWKDIPISLMIIDGSNTPLNNECLKNSYPNLTYIHSFTSFSERIGIASKLKKKEYTIFLGDDEFYSVRALQNCVLFLENNQDYVSCMGQCVAFKVAGNKIVGNPIYEEFFERKNDHNSNFERIYYHMSNYTCSSIYSVIRTSVWDTAFSLIPKLNCNVFAIEEYQIELAVAFIGKTKILNELLWFRSFEVNSHSHNKKLNYFTEWWTNRKKNVEKEKLIKNISTGLSHYTKINELEIQNGVSLAFDLFYNWNISFAPLPTFKKSPYFYFGHKLPVFFKYLFFPFRPIYTLFRPKNKAEHFNLDDILIKLQSRGYIIFQEDIFKIKSSIYNFHNIPN